MCIWVWQMGDRKCSEIYKRLQPTNNQFFLFPLQSNYVFLRNSSYSTSALLQHLSTLPILLRDEPILVADILPIGLQLHDRVSAPATTSLSTTETTVESLTREYQPYHINGYSISNEYIFSWQLYEQFNSQFSDQITKYKTYNQQVRSKSHEHRDYSIWFISDALNIGYAAFIRTI